jgi:hypothetical protein
MDSVTMLKVWAVFWIGAAALFASAPEAATTLFNTSSAVLGVVAAAMYGNRFM